MKTTHLALVLALLSPVAACSGGAAGAGPQAAQAASTKAPLTVSVDGPLRTIADAFAEVPLRPDQRTEIESMMAAAQQRHQSLRPLAKDFVTALADQIEKGAIDEAALAPKLDAGIAAFKPVQAEDRKAIQRAHDLLDAGQRAALTDALEAKREGRFGKRLGGGRDARFGKIAEELNLTGDQKAKLFEAIRAEMHAGGEHGPSWGEWKERREHATEAFKADAFDVDKDMPAIDAQAAGKKMFERGVRFAKVALPILTPEQRVTAAKLLRERAEHFADLH